MVLSEIKLLEESTGIRKEYLSDIVHNHFLILKIYGVL